MVVEKPYGRDLDSAIALDEQMHAAFDESQIYRIDHYMGKETVQNVLALRFANAIFEPIWNRRYVEQVQVTVAESLGVEHRGGFYETAGALRDIVQNHVMQVLALTLMESPTSTDADRIRDEKVKLLQAIDIPTPDEAVDKSVRGQYGPGVIDGEKVSATARSTTSPPTARPRPTWPSGSGWRTGDGPASPSTCARASGSRPGSPRWPCTFRQVPFLLFDHRTSRDLRPNALILRIQPDEGISLEFGAKVPGEKFHLRSVAMDFSYAEAFAGSEAADGYERLIHDAMVGDATLFIRSDEVQQAWRIVDPYLQAWSDRAAAMRLLPGRDLGTAHGRPAGRAVRRRVAQPGDRPRAQRRSARPSSPSERTIAVNGTVDSWCDSVPDAFADLVGAAGGPTAAPGPVLPVPVGRAHRRGRATRRLAQARAGRGRGRRPWSTDESTSTWATSGACRPTTATPTTG